jgi:hypothetical protein
MTVTIGRIVHYTLNEQDAEAINRRREDAALRQAGAQETGFVVHVGNAAKAGDVYPAMCVRYWGSSANFQVFLDGNDTYWATSRSEGEGPGTWAWPARV